MPVAIWLSLIINAQAHGCILKPIDTISTDDRRIRIGDVVELGCIQESERDRIRQLVIAVMPHGQPRVEIERDAVRTLVRRRVPALNLPVTLGDIGKFVIVSTAANSRSAEVTCYRATRLITAGELIVANDLAPASCEGPSSSNLLAFDEAYRAIRATRHIASGDLLGRVDAPTSAFAANAEISVLISVGPVRIERHVHTVQPGIGGRGIFVRDDDGNIFAVPTYVEAEPTE